MAYRVEKWGENLPEREQLKVEKGVRDRVSIVNRPIWPGICLKGAPEQITVAPFEKWIEQYQQCKQLLSEQCEVNHDTEVQLAMHENEPPALPGGAAVTLGQKEDDCFVNWPFYPEKEAASLEQELKKRQPPSEAFTVNTTNGFDTRNTYGVNTSAQIEALIQGKTGVSQYRCPPWTYHYLNSHVEEERPQVTTDDADFTSVITDEDEVFKVTEEASVKLLVDPGATASLLTTREAAILYHRGLLKDVQPKQKKFKSASSHFLVSSTCGELTIPGISTGECFIVEDGLPVSLIGATHLKDTTLNMSAEKPALVKGETSKPLVRTNNGHLFLAFE